MRKAREIIRKYTFFFAGGRLWARALGREDPETLICSIAAKIAKMYPPPKMCAN